MSEIRDKATIHGAKSVIPPKYDSLSLVELLAGEQGGCPPENAPPENDVLDDTHTENNTYNANDIYAAKSYQCGINKFYSRVAGHSEAGKRMERNRVQERILSVAADRCNAYKQFLRYDQAESGFLMGGTATLMGALGAIAPSATAARTYAASAGALSGIDAEYNQSYFGNLFYSVIAKAIDESRREAYREIQEYGQKKNLADYPVEAAIKDAIVYDGMCSAVSALEYAEQSVRLVNDPGIDSLNRVLVKANQARTILEKKTIDLAELQHDEEGKLVSTLENIRFGSRLGTNAGAPFDFIQSRLYHAERKIANFAAVMAEIRLRLKSDATAKLDKNKDAWEKSIKGAFDKIFTEPKDGVYPAYQKNIQACTTAIQTGATRLAEAKAAATKARADEQRAATDKAVYEVGQAQSEIDKLTESAGFATRHLDNLVAKFVELAVGAIAGASAETKEPVGAPTVSAASVNEIGQFDAGCGKLK